MSDKNSYPHYKSSPSWGKRDYNNRNKTMDINKYTQKIRNTSGRRSQEYQTHTCSISHSTCQSVLVRKEPQLRCPGVGPDTDHTFLEGIQHCFQSFTSWQRFKPSNLLLGFCQAKNYTREQIRLYKEIEGVAIYDRKIRNNLMPIKRKLNKLQS